MTWRVTGRRLPRLTIRGRLTLVYGGLFLVAGLLLLGVTYVLVYKQLHGAPEGAKLNTEGAAFPPGVPSDSGPPDKLLVQQATDDARDDTLRTLLTQGGIALVVVGVLATLFGWLAAGRLLQPLHRMTATARRIADAPLADRGLHERIALDGPRDEIKELADTFDVMLKRLDQSFDGQRRFIANASHELRTPLTLNRTLLEVTLRRSTASPEVRQLGETLLEINRRHGRLIDGLLLLARSERGVSERSYLDLADLVEHVADQLPASSVDVLTKPGEAPTTGSPVLLERLVQNLVENGVRHNIAQGGWVEVSSETGPDGGAVLVVCNTGPAVPRYEIPNLFIPFRRLAPDRIGSSGAGLGLSIVEAIARAHGGEVHAEPRDGGGLIVTVQLPGAPV
jgi:signal transduction histidine kinase